MISKVLSSNNSTQLLKYIGKDDPHHVRYSNHRNLLVYTQNLDNDYSGKPNYMYTAMQMRALRQASGRDKKDTQAFHLIISFSERDFPPTYGKKLKRQARQARDLVVGFLNERFVNSSQYYLCVQRDGRGGMLHVHLAINSVTTKGTVFNTQQLTMFDNEKRHIKGFKKEFDNYLVKNFKRVTGREFKPVVPKKEQFQKSKVYRIKEREDYIWQDDLRDSIDVALRDSTNIEEFEANLAKYNVTIKRKTYHKKPSFTYYFTDARGKKQRMRAYRKDPKTGLIQGLGRIYMPDMVQAQLHQNALKRSKKKRKRKSIKKQPVVQRIHVGTRTNHVNQQKKAPTTQPVKRVPNKRKNFVKKSSPDMSLQELFEQNTNNYQNTKQQENDHPYLP